MDSEPRGEDALEACASAAKGREPAWTMGCGVSGCEAEAPSNGIDMPEGWGFYWSGFPDEWKYACPAPHRRAMSTERETAAGAREREIVVGWLERTRHKISIAGYTDSGTVLDRAAEIAKGLHDDYFAPQPRSTEGAVER